MRKAIVEKIAQVGFAGVVADELILAINDFIEEKGSCSLVLAGGKTPASIYRSLSVPPRRDEINWKKVKLFLDDERFVPFEHDQNNYKMVHKTLVSKLPHKPEIVKIDTDNLTIEESYKKYKEDIKKSMKLNEGELPVFDLVLLGIGKDGFTASIFPGTELPEKEKEICYIVDESERCAYKRVTLSSHVLFGARKIFFIACDEAKAEIVQKVLEGDYTPKEIPVMLYKNVEDKVTFFLGGAASMLLKDH
ncbi:MAG: 6-phosphogluconolactonase [Bdellovibrionota bacterium]|jgi:6-phosphogluconolactonase